MGGVNHRRLALTEDQNPLRRRGRSSSLASERDPRSFSPTPRSENKQTNKQKVITLQVSVRPGPGAGPDLSHELGLVLGADGDVESAHGVEQMVDVQGLADASPLEELEDKQEVQRSGDTHCLHLSTGPLPWKRSCSP